MEESQVEKKVKSSKPLKTTTLRIQKETKKRIVSELVKINRKDFGKKIRIDDYLNLAIGLVNANHVQELQEESLSNGDRLKRDYKDYIAKNGPMLMDEYLGKRLRGEIKGQESIGAEPSQ